jgi:hypothetical protein
MRPFLHNRVPRTESARLVPSPRSGMLDPVRVEWEVEAVGSEGDVRRAEGEPA